MRVNRLFLLCSAMLLSLAGCGPSKEVEECVANGVAYFKEIGSYPTLTSPPNQGRRAEDVARERCNRTTTAFPKRT
jgi:hypothetical protein